MKTALTIAGSDTSGGAGIQGDLKTFAAHGVYGMSVITAVTAQNTVKVSHIQGLDPITIEKQIEAIFSDINLDSIKIGMLYSRRIIHAVLKALEGEDIPPMVLDPVIVSTTGRVLLRGDAITLMLDKLFPLCDLVTPNIYEAELITSKTIHNLLDMEEACRHIYQLGAKHVLLKGGHLEGKATDILYDGKRYTHYEHERIDNPHTHGTGCALSSAIASNWSLGYDTSEAVRLAKDYITKAIAHGFPIGAGHGPIQHFTKGV